MTLNGANARSYNREGQRKPKLRESPAERRLPSLNQNFATNSSSSHTQTVAPRRQPRVPASTTGSGPASNTGANGNSNSGNTGSGSGSSNTTGEEIPARVTEDGLKIGKCYRPSGQTDYKCFGWVYEKSGLNYSALEGVDVDIVFFGGCLTGNCTPLVPAVRTNSHGYFELFTSALLDTIRIHSPSGYYGVCNGRTPISGGGTLIPGSNVNFRNAFIQERLTTESCNPTSTNPSPGQLDLDGREIEAAISAEGLKIGQCYQANATQGKYKCYGWIYEKVGTNFVPQEDVSVDIIWFAGCMMGSCNPMAQAVQTDDHGYFEIYVDALLDTLRIHSRTGYYGVCNGTQPLSGGGTFISASSNNLNRPFRDAFKQYRLTENSCH